MALRTVKLNCEVCKANKSERNPAPLVKITFTSLRDVGQQKDDRGIGCSKLTGRMA